MVSEERSKNDDKNENKEERWIPSYKQLYKKFWKISIKRLILKESDIERVIKYLTK